MANYLNLKDAKDAVEAATPGGKIGLIKMLRELTQKAFEAGRTSVGDDAGEANARRVEELEAEVRHLKYEIDDQKYEIAGLKDLRRDAEVDARTDAARSDTWREAFRMLVGSAVGKEQ